MKICYGRRPKSGNGRLRDFASKMSPFLVRFLAVARLTHFHRSGTWLTPTDISQTFFTFFETNICAEEWRTSPRERECVCVKIIDFANLNSHFFALYCNFATRRATNVANEQNNNEHARVGKRVYADDPRPPSDHLQGLLHLHNGRLHDRRALARVSAQSVARLSPFSWREQTLDLDLSSGNEHLHFVYATHLVEASNDGIAIRSTIGDRRRWRPSILPARTLCDDQPLGQIGTRADTALVGRSQLCRNS